MFLSKQKIQFCFVVIFHKLSRIRPLSAQDAWPQASAAAAGFVALVDGVQPAGEVREEGVRGDADQVPAVRGCQD